MKPPLLTASILAAASLLFAEDPKTDWQGKKVPRLILANGKIYTEVTFSQIEADAITVTHSGGIVRIPMESLKPEAQAALDYNPEKAASARKLYLEQRSATHAAITNRLNEEQAQQNAIAAKLAWQEAARIIIIEITQVIDGEGILGRVDNGDDLQFVELDTDAYSFHDGWRGTLKAVLMEEPYRYTSVLGASKTVRRWVIFEE